MIFMVYLLSISDEGSIAHLTFGRRKQMETATRLSKLALTGSATALVGILLALLAGFGTRMGAWQFGTGFVVLKWGAILALAGLVLSLVSLFFTRFRRSRRGTPLALLGVTLAIVTITPPMFWLYRATRLPMIHDISTDTVNPPPFETLLPLRNNATNTAVYGGANIAKLQHKAYPNIKPALFSRDPQNLFDAALAVARKMGWTIVANDPQTGRIEATDTTFWFGFTDDVVIRIEKQQDKTRVDVRSLSRVGRSDVGTNARRIAAYLKALRLRLE
jgi:uncharacterized protein (DUF1499 family)